MAATYPLRNGPSIPPVDEMLKRIDNAWPFSKATFVFDTGCGPGVVMGKIIWDYGESLNSEAKLLAGDFSKAMVEALQKTRQQESSSGSPVNQALWQKLEARVIDAQDLSSIPSDSVSHLTGGYVFFMLPDAQKALVESKRVLVRDGVIGGTFWHGNEWLDMTSWALKQIRPDCTPYTMPEAWTSPEGLRAQFEKAGFRAVDAGYVQTTLDFETHEKLVETMMGIPLLAVTTKEWSDDERSSAKEKMLAWMRQHYPQQPGTMKGTALYLIARK